MARLFVLGFLLLPLVEIALFIKVGQTIGLLPTLGLVIGAALVGALLLRQQGLAILGQLQSSLNSGKMPARTLAEAMMIGTAAVFLVLPGFFSDVVALLLLLQPVRGWIFGALSARIVVASTGGPAQGPIQTPRVGRPDTIDLDGDDYRPS